MKAWFWNLRFHLGWRILPGDHKHISIPEDGKTCPRCKTIYQEIQERGD